MAPPTSHHSQSPIQNNGWFWKINAGHLVTIITIMASMAFMYGQFSQRIEALESTSVLYQQNFGRIEAAMVSIQTIQATTSQDMADMHRTVDADLSRRLDRLEAENGHH